MKKVAFIKLFQALVLDKGVLKVSELINLIEI